MESMSFTAFLLKYRKKCKLDEPDWLGLGYHSYILQQETSLVIAVEMIR
jgi:hypothetical protein